MTRRTSRKKSSPEERRRRPTLVEIQRDNVNALEQWVKFANGDRDLSTQDLANLIFATLRRFARVTPDVSEIEELRRWLLNGFNRIIDEGEWVIPSRELGDFSIVIGRTGTAYEESSSEGRALAGLALAKLLNADESWRLARCGWCGKDFVKRKRSEYCSPKCSRDRQTFKTRNKARWAAVSAAAQKAKMPLATWLHDQRKKRVRLVTICPGCKHKFEVPALLTWIQCPGCRQDFLTGERNTTTTEVN